MSASKVTWRGKSPGSSRTTGTCRFPSSAMTRSAVGSSSSVSTRTGRASSMGSVRVGDLFSVQARARRRLRRAMLAHLDDMPALIDVPGGLGGRIQLDPHGQEWQARAELRHPAEAPRAYN